MKISGNLEANDILGNGARIMPYRAMSLTGATTIDLSLGSKLLLTLSGNSDITFTNPVVGAEYQICFITSSTAYTTTCTNTCKNFPQTELLTTSSQSFYKFDYTPNNEFVVSAGTLPDTTEFRLSKMIFRDIDEPAHEEGLVYYDYVKKALVLYDDIAGTSIELSYEIPMRAINNTGSTILNGSVCYVNNALSGLPTVELADSTSYVKSRVIGVATHDVLPGTSGKFVWFGVIHDVDTSGFSLGDTVYLDPNNPGRLINTTSSGGIFQVRIGTVTYVDNINGSMQLNILSAELTEELICDNGWPDKTNILLTSDDASRTIYVAPANSVSVRYYQRGELYRVTTPKSCQIPDVEGLYYVYINNETLTYLAAGNRSQEEGMFRNNVPVALVYWNATNKAFVTVIKYWHYSVGYGVENLIKDHYINGSMYDSGFQPDDFVVSGDGTLAAHAQFSVSSGTYYDTDIKHSIAGIAATTGLKILYRDSNLYVRSITNAGFPVATYGSGRIAYNSPTGGLVEVTTGSYVWYHIFAVAATTGVNSIVTMPGQSEYALNTDAYIGLTADASAVKATTSSADYVLIGSVLFQTSNSYTNAVKGIVVPANTDNGEFADWRVSGLSSGSGSGGGGITTPSFADSDFEIYNIIDITKKVKVDTSAIDTAVTRTLTIPNKSGTIALIEDSVRNIVTSTSWNGQQYTIDLSANALYKRIVNDTISTLIFSLAFPSDAATVSRSVTIILDNSTNTVPISTITFGGGNWRWDVGVLPTGLAAGAIATLELYNESNTDVKPNWTVRA
jgi:hypothetical protein